MARLALLGGPPVRTKPFPSWPIFGDADRYFHAYDVRTGKPLWQTRLTTSVQGFPMSFAIDGRQYIAVTTGLGGGSPRRIPSLLAREVRNPETGNALYVFRLRGRS